jgi:hypothetical protein
MIAFIAYVAAVSLFLVAAATASEPLVRAIRQPTRSVWIAAIVGAVTIALVTLWAPHPGVRSLVTGATTQGVVETATTPATSLPGGDGDSFDRRSSDVVMLARETEPATRGPTAVVSLATLLIAACWLVGSLGCLACLLIGARRIGRLRRSCREGGLCGERVLVSATAGPAVLGVLRYRIVIPAWVEELDEPAQRLILAHEREHVRARDPLVVHAVMLLVALMPWNIALWFALHRVRAAIEIDCDARVLRGGRAPVRDYCRLLLEVGERIITSPSPLLALAEPATLLERRIESMMTSRTLRDWKTLVPAAGALMLLAGACWAPRPAIGPVTWPGGMSRSLSSASTGGPWADVPDVVAAPAAGRSPASVVSVQPTNLSSSASARASVAAIVSPVADAPSARARVSDTVRNEAALRRSAAEHQARIDAIADSVIMASYPEVTRRPPGTPAFLALVLDDRGRVMRHAISLDPALPTDLAAIMLALQVDTVSARTIGLGISDDDRWNVTVGHAVEALGPVRGHAEMRASMTSARPYSLRRVPYQRIVDSVARARNPEAYREHEGTFAIAMMLDESGHVMRYGAEPRADTSVASARTPELMSRLVGDSTRTGDIVGVTSHLRPSKTVIVWGVHR